MSEYPAARAPATSKLMPGTAAAPLLNEESGVGGVTAIQSSRPLLNEEGGGGGAEYTVYGFVGSNAFLGGVNLFGGEIGSLGFVGGLFAYEEFLGRESTFRWMQG